MDRTMNVSEKEARTMLAVFGELQKMPYDKLNTILGSITIEEMNDLRMKTLFWYYECEDYEEVLEKKAAEYADFEEV